MNENIVPLKLHIRLNWGPRHEAAAQQVMRRYNLTLPRDRELIRTLAFTRVLQGKLPWLDDEEDA